MPALVPALPGGKTNHFGIEVIKGITWQGWEPGREYTKNIVLKNVRVKTQKLKYKVPETRFFHTLYPQPIVLSAGTSFTLPVTFRPLEKTEYQDKVQFVTNEGRFEIPIHAVLPQYGMEVPSDIHFNMCAAEDNIQLTFDIKNISELVTPFVVECEEPFTVDPPEGVLEPYAQFSLTGIFKPKAAAVYETEAVIRFGANYDHSKTIKFEGIGKYPHLVVACNGQVAAVTPGGLESVVDFHEVPIGQTTEKWIELRNLSPVNAPFRVEHSSSQSKIDSVFQSPQKHGVVPANSTIRIPLLFTPNAVNCKSIDYFNVVAIGNISKTVIKCVAASRGPMVRLSTSCVNFLKVNSNYRATKTIEIFNDSDTPASYQFMLDGAESVFGINQPSGVLRPSSHQTLVVNFEPVHPINYYRRITCLVHNQGAIFLDLIGTCHTETAKPAILQQRHLHRYLVHVQRGFSFTPPEQLNDMIKEGQLHVDDAGFIAKEGAAEPLCVDPMDEYFNDGYYSEVTTTEPHVSLDTHEADFGQCSDIHGSAQRNVNITNHTKGKITIVWTGDSSHIFSVSPTTLDIPPLKSSPFTVTFKPGIPNQFFGAELECYAYYKSMRDYRLVEETTQCPPWCLTLTATGNTFQANSETFLPRFKLDSKNVVFPAVNSCEATYRTVKLENTGTTPIMFNFEKDPHGVFSLKPTKGLLTGPHQLFVIKVLPPAVKTYKHTLKLKLNDNAKNTQEIVAWGSAEAAEVVLENAGEMFFKPTCVGTASTRQYAVRNVSRIPLRFQWKMAHGDARFLSVTPEAGIIQPNESQFHEWTFIPLEQSKTVMKPALVVWGQGQSATSSAGKQRQFTLRVIGEGSIGSLKCDMSYVDLGTVVVGSTMSRTFTLVNDGDCSLHFKLSTDQAISGPYPEEMTRDDPSALSLDITEGVLPASSRQTITATVCPLRRVYYKFSISYQLLTPRGKVSAVDTEPQHVCHVLACGVFPTLAVTDARCYGALNSISKKQLWNLLSLDNLNVCLDADPAFGELMYNTATRHTHRRRPPVYTRAILDFNFGAAPLGSQPGIVHLMFENTGSVATDWSFLMPQDLQLELEYWAETGEFDDESLHEMKVMDNKLFVVEPKSGRLEPGACQTISFTYKHDMPGTDRLPVLLKMAHGREILLNFIGVTVKPDMHYIHFPSSKHLFSPVPVGEKTSPAQVYELYNGGAKSVRYEVDCVPLELLRKENFDHAVFECLTPYGEIAPGQTINVEWRFSPLEAKTYMVDVPIRIHNGETALVTFTGVGYDPRVMGDTMPITDSNNLTGVPSIQSVSVPGQLCFLSEERVSFNNLPLFSQVRRMMVMTNRSSEHPVAYEWHVTSKKDAKVVSVTPSRGNLEPGQATVVKVTFTAAGIPAFYDLDLVCEVTNQNDLEVYERELRAWETEKQRQAVEFTITEDNLDADCVLPEPEMRPGSGKLNPLDTRRTPTPEGEMSKYKTLPPIRQRSVDEERARQRIEAKIQDQFWSRPEPPKPFLLHLGVTARTHNIGDYQLNFPEQYRNHFIDRLLSEVEAEGEQEEKPVVKETVKCLQAEADVVAAALNNIIRSLLDDSSFHEAVEKIQEERTPYFKQYSTRGTQPQNDVTMMMSSPSIFIEPADVTASQRPLSQPISLGSYPFDCDHNPFESAFSDADSAKSEPIRARSGSPGEMRPWRPEPNSPGSSAISEDTAFRQQQSIKKTPEFASMVESVLENTLANIISEAFNLEFNVTARPRLVALPPRPRSAAANTTTATQHHPDKNNNNSVHNTLTKPANTLVQSKVGTSKVITATLA